MPEREPGRLQVAPGVSFDWGALVEDTDDVPVELDTDEPPARISSTGYRVQAKKIIPLPSTRRRWPNT